MSTFAEKVWERVQAEGWANEHDLAMAGAVAALRLLADQIDEHNATRTYPPAYWRGKERARLMGIQADQRALAEEARKLASTIEGGT